VILDNEINISSKDQAHLVLSDLLTLWEYHKSFLG